MRKYTYNKHVLIDGVKKIEVEISADLGYSTYLIVINHDANINYSLVGIISGSYSTYHGNILSVINKGSNIDIEQGNKDKPLKIIVNTNQFGIRLIPLAYNGQNINIDIKGVL